MDIHEYSLKLDSVEEPTSANMAVLAGWTEKLALPWLWDEMAGAVLEPKKKHAMAESAPPKRALRAMSDSEALRHGLMVSLKDRASKAADPSYYQAQLTMLDAEANRHCEVMRSWSEDPSRPVPDAAVHTLHRALLEMMRYARVLLEQAGARVADVPGYYGAWRRTFDTPFEVIQAARQIVYGTYSGLAFADRAPSVPVAVLRTAIELRLRDAFCVWGFANTADPMDVQPIDMGTLFEAIVDNQDNIDFAVDIYDVWKIYRWSNHYLHAGFRDWPWVPGFLLAFLWPLFTGGAQSMNINAGIQMPEATWRAVRSSLMQRRSAKLAERIEKAWRALLPKKASRVLHLPECDPQQAGCVLKA